MEYFNKNGYDIYISDSDFEELEQLEDFLENLDNPLQYRSMYLSSSCYKNIPFNLNKFTNLTLFTLEGSRFFYITNSLPINTKYLKLDLSNFYENFVSDINICEKLEILDWIVDIKYLDTYYIFDCPKLKTVIFRPNDFIFDFDILFTNY